MVNGMQIPLSAVAEDGISVDVETSEAELRPAGASELLTGPLHLTGTVSGDGDEFIFHGRLAGTYLGRCDRCLGPAELPFSTDVLWVFAEGTPPHPLEDDVDDEGDGDGAEDGVIHTFFEGNVLDLSTAAWEELVLGTPLKLLCSEDCAGLCPVCGTNLNDAQCNCAAGVSDTTLANKGLKGLKDIFPDLNPDRLED